MAACSFGGAGTLQSRALSEIYSGDTYEYLDAAAGVATTNVGLVGDVADSITDQGSLGNVHSITGSSRPLYEAGGWNGEPSLAFDASNDYLPHSGTSVATLLNTDFAIWIAAQTLASGDQWICSFGSNAATGYHGLVQDASNNRVKYRRNVSSNSDVALPDGTANRERHVYKFVKVGATGTLTRDGILIATNTIGTGTISLDRDGLGALIRSTIAFFASLRFRARLIKPGAVTSLQEAETDAYFARFIAHKTAPQFQAVGDSHTHVAPGETAWIEIVQTEFPGATFVNSAVPGTALSGTGGGLQGVNRAATNFDTSRLVRITFMGFLANDCVSGRSATQMRDDAIAWCVAMRALDPGAILILQTIHKDGGSGSTPEAEVQRALFCAMAETDFAAWGFDDILLRHQLITEDPADTSVFDPDKRHLNDTGEAYIANGRGAVRGVIQIGYTWGLDQAA